MLNMLKKYWFIFDRLSGRHDWQIIGMAETQDRKNFLVNYYIKNYINWSKKEKYPDYQISVIYFEVNDYFSIPENIRCGEIKRGLEYKDNLVIIFKNGELV